MKYSVLNYLNVGKKPGKIPELDGIRAIAILMVLGHHFATFYREYHRTYYKDVITGSLENWLLNGWLGVDLFFVLSGYLIFHHLLRTQQHKQSNTYVRYAVKRILRTFPLYYAMIMIGFIGIIPHFNPDISWLIFIKHVLFLQDYTGNNILVPMWSLATEEKFYLLAPFLLLLTKQQFSKSAAVLLTVILILMIVRTRQIGVSEPITNHIQFFLNYRAPFHFAIISILVGVIVALVEQKSMPKIVPKILLLMVLILMVSLFLFNFYHVENWQWLNISHTLLVLMFGVIIYAAVKLSGNKWLRILRGRFLRVIAVLSYALYLVHYAVLPWVLRLHKQHIYNETSWIHALSFLLIYLGLTAMVSLLLHYLIEKPFLVLKDRLR